MTDSYRQLKIGQWEELRSIDTTQEDIDIQVDIIAILNGMTRDEVLDLQIDRYMEYAKGTAFLSQSPKAKPRRPERINLNGRKYRVIKSAKDMTAGQYIDFQTYLSQGAEKNIAPILSTVVIPEGRTYGNGYDIAEAIQDIRNGMSVQDALDLSAFFLSQSAHLIDSILTSLERRMRRMKKTPETEEKMKEAVKRIHLLRDLINNGDGLLPWTVSRKG